MYACVCMYSGLQYKIYISPYFFIEIFSIFIEIFESQVSNLSSDISKELTL